MKLFLVCLFSFGFYFYWKPIQPTKRACDYYGIEYLGHSTRFGSNWFYCKYFAVGFSEYIKGVKVQL